MIFNGHYIAPFKPVANITPFTYRDGMTYLEVLEDMRKYVNETLVATLNESVVGLGDDFETEVNRVIAEIDTAIAEVGNALETQDQTVDTKLADLTTFVNDSIQQIIDNSVSINDAISSQLIDNTESATRGSLDNIYAKSADLDTTNTNLSTVQTDLSSLEGTVSGVQSDVTTLNSNVSGALTTIGDIETDIEDIDTLTTSGRLSEPYLDSRYKANVQENYDFDSAEAEYGIRLSGSSSIRVMQSVFVSNRHDRQIITAYAENGTTGDRETTLVTLHSASGKAMGEMRFIDAGHGTGVWGEFTEDGLYIWTSFVNHSVAVGTTGYENTVRVPWQAGASVTWANVVQYKVSAVSRIMHLTTHYDEVNDIIGVRERHPNNVGADFSVHTRANILAGIWAPIMECSYTYPSDLFTQNWTYLDGYWYIYSGAFEDRQPPPYYPAELFQIDANTGALVSRRQFEVIRNGANGGPVRGSSEPEGLCVGRGYGGAPTLIAGVSSGTAGNRTHTLWSIGNGVDPFVGVPNDYYAGSTDWQTYPVESWLSGFNGDTDPVQSFQVRITGEYLEMRGRVLGSFVNGANRIAKLRSGFFGSRVMRGVGVKPLSSSTSITARIEVVADGYIDVTIEGTATWVDFSGFKVPM